MPRRAAGLTAVKVRTARPGRYGDGKGLYLLVRSSDARFWLFRYRRDGRMREMGLGSVADVSLAEAREKAASLHRTVKGGIDPLAEREARASAEKAATQTGRKPLDHEPLAYRIEDARRAIGVGTTRLYELIGAGVLDARKSGNRTLITGDSLRRYIADLPKADIRTGQRTPA